MSLKELIVEWISNDNKMEELRTQIDDIDEIQDELTDRILTYVEDNSMVGKKVNMSGGSIEFKIQTHYPSLTQKTVSAALAEHGIDPTPIIETIREMKSRDRTQQTHMIRHYDKNQLRATGAWFKNIHSM